MEAPIAAFLFRVYTHTTEKKKTHEGKIPHNKSLTLNIHLLQIIFSVWVSLSLPAPPKPKFSISTRREFGVAHSYFISQPTLTQLAASSSLRVKKKERKINYFTCSDDERGDRESSTFVVPSDFSRSLFNMINIIIDDETRVLLFSKVCYTKKR